MIQTRTTPRPLALWKQAENERNGLPPNHRAGNKDSARGKVFSSIQRKTFPKRSSWSSEKRVTGKKPSKPLRQFSNRRLRVTRLYLFVRGFFLVRHPKCAGDSKKSATEVHHFQGKVGTLYLDWRFWLAVSRDTHNWIGDNIEAAQERGLLAPKGFWNNAPADERTRQLKEIIQCAQTDYPEARRMLIVLMQQDGLVPDTSPPPK